ncbi:DUF317 domain-containing protein [Kitasatospora sp. NPDC088783]|uniref:DUF317 domain-containing protein n=1 Tax=Kitasatospora sp. NPDC088783 TaxID=3364077 RepID=UPI0037F337FE
MSALTPTAPEQLVEVDGDVHLHPVYLAGSDYTGDPAFRPLNSLGVRTHHDGAGNYYAQTFDGKVRVGFIPEQDWDTLWKIAVHPDAFSAPAWVASFSEDTPTEIPAAVTREIAAMYDADDDGWLHARTPAALESLAPYAAAGWNLQMTSLGTLVADSPDGHAQITRRRIPLGADQREQDGQDGRHTLDVGTPREGWYGRFSSATPARILSAVATAMLNPAPAVRYRSALSPYARRTATITPVLPPTPTPLDVHRALASRTRTAPLTVRSAPAAASLVWSTASPATAPARR